MARPLKYASVAQTLRGQIAAGALSVGEPLPSEQALADRFGVTRVTLRKALASLVASGDLQKRPRQGCFVRPAAAPGARNGPLLYVGGTTEHFYGSFYEALCRHAAVRGRSVTAFTPSAVSGDAVVQLCELAASHRRVICMEDYWRLVRGAVPASVRVTRVSGAISIEGNDASERPSFVVSSDTYRAAKLAVEHLADLGHRRLGYVDAGGTVAGDPMAGAVPSDSAPYLGFLSGVRERGLCESCVLAVPHRLIENSGVDFAETHERFFNHHLARIKTWPTAFVCVTDFRAGPLIRALGACGRRVPNDVSLIGLGNTPWAQAIDPPLTSVCLGEDEMARMAILLNEEPEPEETRIVRVDPKLVARRSTARVKGG